MAHIKNLPIVRPFNVATLGLEFIDRRTIVENNDLPKSYNKWSEHISVIFTQRGISLSDVVCRNDDVAKNQQEIELFHEALQSNPEIDFLEWRDAQPLTKDNDLDPMKPDLFFCVRDTSSNEWVGGFSMSNIDIELDDTDQIICGGIMLLGIPNTVDLVNTWVTAYQTILNVPCVMEDGRQLHLVEDRFLSEQGMRNVASTDAEIIEMWARMGDHFNTTGDITNPEQNTSIRRLGI